MDCADSLKRVAYIVSQELVKVSSLLPSNRNRSLLVHSLVSKFGLLETGDATNPAEPEFKFKSFQVVNPRPASATELCLYHDKDHVDHILNDELSNSLSPVPSHSEFGIEDDCPHFFGLGRYVQMVAGATLSAAHLLKSDQSDVSICWDGGRHHAQKSRAAGFCYVADCILAILSLKKAPPLLALAMPQRKARVMYLDFDLHFSDAVSECFYKSAPSSAASQVLTLSIHHTSQGFFPPSAFATLPDPTSAEFDPFSLSLPLKQGASSKSFACIWGIVERIRATFCPDYVIVQCGTDGLAGDPCSTWNWSLGPETGSIGWCVSKIIREWNARVLLLGGGGYNSQNTARTWAYLTSIARGNPLQLDAPIPDHDAFPLYAPSFTLDVPAGNMRDENTEEYLSHIEEVYSVVLPRLQERMGRG